MKKRRLAMIPILSIPVTLLVGTGWFLDMPAIPDAPPAPFTGVGGLGNASYYTYFLGGYLDQEYLVRIDLKGADPTALFRALDMRAADEIPAQFWRKIPCYWPRSKSSTTDAYTSSNFDPRRGADGLNFFAIHDRKKDRVFVWVKDNF